MKPLLFSVFLFSGIALKAQKIDSIYVDLYTDSLKKGTFNYINIDGKLSNGRYLPLDTNHLVFSSSAGRFNGNNLWIDKDFLPARVSIKAVLKSNPGVYKEFDIFVKQLPDNEKLKTTDEILKEMRQQPKKTKKGK